MRPMKLLALGGALLFIAAGPTLAQGRRGGGFGRGGPGMLMMMPEVRAELKLDAAQAELVTALQEEMRTKAQAAFQDFQSLSPEERQKRFAAFSAEYNKEIAKILDPKQMARLKQLEIQRDGNRALGRPEVADQLKLTADQRSRIAAALQSEREAMRAAFQGFGNGGGNGMSDTDREAARAKFQEVRTGTDTKLSQVLTDAQKQQFKSMQGAAFTFPQRRGFGGPRGPQ